MFILKYCAVGSTRYYNKQKTYVCVVRFGGNCSLSSLVSVYVGTENQSSSSSIRQQAGSEQPQRNIDRQTETKRRWHTGEETVRWTTISAVDDWTCSGTAGCGESWRDSFVPIVDQFGRIGYTGRSCSPGRSPRQPVGKGIA